MPVRHFVAIHEIRDGRRQFAHLLFASATKFSGDIGSDIFRPAVGRIEGHDAERIGVLARKEILHNDFQVRGFVLCLAPGAA